MRIKDSFFVGELAEGIKLVPADPRYHFFVSANDSAAFLLRCLKDDSGKKGITKKELLQKLLEEYDVAPERAEKDMDKLLDELRSLGALEEE